MPCGWFEDEGGQVKRNAGGLKKLLKKKLVKALKKLYKTVQNVLCKLY